MELRENILEEYDEVNEKCRSLEEENASLMAENIMMRSIIEGLKDKLERRENDIADLYKEKIELYRMQHRENI